MSKIADLNLDELKLEFMDVDGLVNLSSGNQSDTLDNKNEHSYMFGPSKNQLESYDTWEGCDGKFFFPYNKDAKVGKYCDFISAAIQLQKEKEYLDAQRYKKSRMKVQQPQKDVKNTRYNKNKPEESKVMLEEEQNAENDEDGWTQIQELRPKKKEQNYKGPYNKNNYNQRNQNNNKQGQYQNKVQIAKQANTKKARFRQNYFKNNMIRRLGCNLRENSINIKPEWDLIHEFSMQTLERLPKLHPVFMKSVKECGEVYAYDISWDKATGKKPKPIKAFEGSTFEEPLFDDPIMQDLMENDMAEIFTTDVVAAILMCAPKSNYSWDLEVTKYGEQIFIDKRKKDDPEFNILNYHTVSENANDGQPHDNRNEMNGIKNLMAEAKDLNDSWLHYSRTDNVASKHELEDENPFISDEYQVASRVGYLYKIWKIQEKDATKNQPEKRICIRCAVHTQTGVKENGERTFMNCYALHEYNDKKTNWKNNIDKAIIDTLSTEIADNSFKVSRWLVQSMLSNVEKMKFAFISRKENNNNKKHVVVKTHTLNTEQWAKQMNMSLDNMWNIIKHVCESVENSKKLKEEMERESGRKPKQVDEEDKKKEDEEEDEADGEYVLIKDFNKSAIQMYKKDAQE